MSLSYCRPIRTRLVVRVQDMYCVCHTTGVIQTTKNFPAVPIGDILNNGAGRLGGAKDTWNSDTIGKLRIRVTGA